MATISPHYNLNSISCDRRHVFGFLLFPGRFSNARFLQRRYRGDRFSRLVWKHRVCCKSDELPSTVSGVGLSSSSSPATQHQPETLQLRRCSPILESALLSNDNVLDSGDWKAVPDIWKFAAERYGDRTALVDPYHDPPSKLTYKELEQEILEFCQGLRVLGIKPDEKLSLFADNSCRWLVADQGIMATGAINVVRGTRSSVVELLQIYKHSESVALVVDNPDLFNRISDTFISRADIRFIILLWGEKSCLGREVMDGIPVFNYKEIIDLGRESHIAFLDSHEEGMRYIYEAINSDDIATLVYTSGTTGTPKGVMLTHQNLLHQIKNLWDIVPAEAGDRFLSMLPPWHAYERAAEYFTFTCGVEQVYTTIKNLKEDLQRYQPHYLISVPLVYETLYRGIQKQISTSSSVRKLIALTLIKISLVYMEFKRVYEGKFLTRNQKQDSIVFSMLDWLWASIITAVLWPLHMLGVKLVYSKIHSAIGISKAGISGGGSLPLYVDRFFEAIGVKLQNGYGLTESSPVVAARRLTCNVLGSVGHPLQHTEIKIVDSETAEVLGAGSKGIVMVRGPQVMKGYYKNQSATKAVLNEEGWLSTGDIGWIAPNHSRGRSRHCGGVLVLEGRAKDTIVLTTGENVEPSELEEAAMRSNLILQIVVIGQDQRRLGALIVPNKEELLTIAKKSSLLADDTSELSKEKITTLLHEELRKWMSECSFQIGPILILDEPFTIESGLMTPTMKIRRDKVVARYSDLIAQLYKSEINIAPWDEEFRNIKVGSQALNWTKKQSHAYWKGNPDVASPLRIELLKCNDSKKWGAEILRQNWAEEGRGGFKKSKLADQCKHRYKIYSEGYAWSVSLKYILSCGSLTLIISPQYEDFFSRGLMPRENYWPVSLPRLCQSIKSAVDWGNANPSEAEAIGKGGQKLMETLDMERVYDYMYHLITEYSKLQDFKPAPPPSSQEMCLESVLCFADPSQRKFLKKSTVSASSSLPCMLPRADRDLIQSWIQKKRKIISDVQKMEE